MQVHLVDGTYELFRHYFAVPPSKDDQGREVGALLGVLQSMWMLLRDGATHIGVATDHVVESFRNDMWAGYKSGEGIEPQLLEQFHPLEDALESMGLAGKWQQAGPLKINIQNSGPEGAAVSLRFQVPTNQTLHGSATALASWGIELGSRG